LAIRVALSHLTRYDYARPIQLGRQLVRLRPAPHNRTPIHRYSLAIRPERHFVNWQQDPHGNFVARLAFPELTTHFEVCVDLVVDLEAFDPFDFFLDPAADRYPFEYENSARRELDPFLDKLPLEARAADFMRELDKSPRNSVDFLVDVNRAVERAVRYVIRMNPGVQTPEQTLAEGQGSCRDSAWLLTQVLRQLGIAARFVSGYLIQLTPDQRPTEGPPGPTRDFTDLHAWCEAYVPGAGWIGLDPTSGLLAAEGHIPLACTALPDAAGPIEGSLELVETKFDYHMAVTRIAGVPRVTKPYADEQWSALCELGHKVDGDLIAHDVRLSMGGEPTFVSAKNPDAPEWNIAALGGDKEAIADALLHRLRSAWQPHGALFHGQGKWYPGEQLPRWTLSCFFRSDEQPLWRDARWLGRSDRDYGHGIDEARRFVERLLENLGLSTHGLAPAHEDVWFYLWRERRLPVNVDPLESRLADEAERERLARVFRHGLGNPVGWLLPLRHDGRWISGEWLLREGHCFLLPGDSPMGFRLPLDSLPWQAEVDYDGGHPPDPFAPRSPLPERFDFPPHRPAPRDAVILAQSDPARHGASGGAALFEHDALGKGWAGKSVTGVTRTALCVEPRAGRLRVFLPPLHDAAVWVELISALEATARQTELPIQLEGYEPPPDPRIGVFRVTPDPGVIEVNVPPQMSFDAVRAQTETLYECAREEHLVAEKFELDGTHIGSGGGNHIVLGGPTAADSPFLRRPDLLKSLVGYWHNHPSLSYLFSGRFIGPTSQAPRVDEARNDSAFELALALARLPPSEAACPPWLVDRVFRHILTDVTGNTHRAEFCIDKLYNPDGPGGRLGLVELRCFEMPPHARMAVAEQLLVRALTSAFFREPYDAPLVKWGTLLHDRYLLSHFVAQDFRQVLRDLDARGYAFDSAWFAPHHEFRFPFVGRLVHEGLMLELRQALEPWLVLGEEASAGGQARFVDSSLERLEARVSGGTRERYAVACNGIELPLAYTTTEGEAVCGVRFRAWQPPSGLHPTIGIHSPLHFDVYDRWSHRAVAGCTYHVVHPGGRSPDTRPINAAAAEGRRIARFETRGHTPGEYALRPAPENPYFPLTLDLRAVGP
jgi:uncharacterized protein (DUF2126 family)